MMTNANLYAAFERAFPIDRERILLTTSTGERYTYADAESISARYGNCLLLMGAQTGDRVTVQVEKSPQNLFLYLACLRAGLVYHPLNTAYRESELRYFIENAEPKIAICDTSGEELFRKLGAPNGIAIHTLDRDGSGTLSKEAANASPILETAIVAGNSMAALLYSSGTTGQPKGIVLSHDNLRSSAETLTDYWGFTSEDCLLHALPIYHVHGLFVASGCVLLSGASMRWHNHFEATAVAEDLVNSSVMMGVPTFYTRLLNLNSFGVDNCPDVRLFISGSAPLLPDTFIEFEQRTGQRILERYGMTETSMNTSNPLHGVRKAGTVGPALPGVEVRVVDDTGDIIEDTETGNLQVRGNNVFSGYWRMPEKTAEDFTDDGFFNTGDKACIDRDGYVSIVGRAKDMIICGGLNVYPKEIELVLDDMAGITESAVIGIADADFGEVVVAILVAEESPPPVETIISQCRSLLANFKIPKQVHYVASLPRNAMGKVQKNLLRETYSDISGEDN
jgi:malonyl-CoA/methylmalonyl-CoA synthetase